MRSRKGRIPGRWLGATRASFVPDQGNLTLFSGFAGRFNGGRASVPISVYTASIVPGLALGRQALAVAGLSLADKPLFAIELVGLDGLSAG